MMGSGGHDQGCNVVVKGLSYTLHASVHWLGFRHGQNPPPTFRLHHFWLGKPERDKKAPYAKMLGIISIGYLYYKLLSVISSTTSTQWEHRNSH